MSDNLEPGAGRSGVVVHIVDDDAAMRTALSRLLAAGGFGVRAHDSAAQFLAAPPPSAPGCILLDVNMPGLSGLQLQDHLAQVGNPLPIVFLTGDGNIAMSVRAIKAGAEDFLSKPVGRAELFDAVDRAVLRCRQGQHDAARQRDMAQRLDSLTPREAEVFQLVVRGLLNKQIAHQLGNTERTVKAHRHSVMEKMQAGSLAELVLIASRLGLLQSGPNTGNPSSTDRQDA
ncbi:MAG: response regulator transcription factor [Telluria sp.]